MSFRASEPPSRRPVWGCSLARACRRRWRGHNRAAAREFGKYFAAQVFAQALQHGGVRLFPHFFPPYDRELPQPQIMVRCYMHFLLTRFVRGTTLWRHIWRGFVVIAIIAKSASRHAPTKQLRLLGNEIRPTTRPAKTPLDEAGPNGASSEECACFGVGLIGHHLRARSK